MDKKKGKRMKKSKNSNLYNISIFVCITLIIISIIVWIKQKDNFIQEGFKMIASKIDFDSKKNTQNKNESRKQITESEARKKAVEKFKEIGENLTENDLEVVTLERDDDLYYYISSKENTLEIRISDGEITRVNSVVV